MRSYTPSRNGVSCKAHVQEQCWSISSVSSFNVHVAIEKILLWLACSKLEISESLPLFRLEYANLVQDRQHVGYMVKKGSFRDTASASKQRKENRDAFLRKHLWSVFEQVELGLERDYEEYYDASRGALRYSDLARVLEMLEILTPTGKKTWSRNSVKNYWLRYRELKDEILFPS